MLRWNKTFRIIGLLVICAAGCRKPATGSSGKYVPFVDVTGEQEVSTEVTSLDVTALAGRVRLVAAPDEKVRVTAEVKIKQTRAKTETGAAEFADHVRLELHGAKLSVADAHIGQPDQDDWQVSLAVHAPARLTAAVSVTAGEITVGGMESDLELRTETGKIVVTGETVGRVTAHTAAGLIDIRADRIDGDVKATAAVGSVSLRIAKAPPTRNVRLGTETGDVLLDLPKDSPGTYRAASTIGNVSISGHEGISVTRTGLGAQAEGTVGEGGPVYDVTAEIGAVRVR